MKHAALQLSFALRAAEQRIRRLEALLHAVDELEAETFWFSPEDLEITTKARSKPRFQPIVWSGLRAS